MMAESGRHAAEDEAIEAVETLTATTSSPSRFGVCIKIVSAIAPCSLRTRALKLQRRQPLFGRLEGFGRMRLRPPYFFLDIQVDDHRLGQKRRAERRRSSTCKTVIRGSTKGRLATRLSSHSPYFDPSIATRATVPLLTGMNIILSSRRPVAP